MARRGRIDDAVLRTPAARCLFPGLALDEDGPREAVLTRDAAMLRRLEQLLVCLRRVHRFPGGSDDQFIRSACSRALDELGVEDRRRVLRLSWVYRLQLPAELRATGKFG